MDYQVWMERLHQGDLLQLAPMIRTVQSEKLSYQMNVRRVDGSNLALTRQAGAVATLAQDVTHLTQISFNYHQGEQCDIELSIEQEGAVLGRHHFKCTE